MLKTTKLENGIDLVQFIDLEKFNALVAEDIKDDLVKFFDAPNSKVVIDLTGVKYIDSSGFGSFLAAMKASRNNYGILKLYVPEKDVKNLFITLQLHTVFEIFDNLEICLASF